ncbi:MAG TPA: hypothetical protein VN604_09370 [Nitrospirota bacterium]|jgi:hypothetical protein|nr:hypothetical protein [Nitrospirota bacterium]
MNQRAFIAQEGKTAFDGFAEEAERYTNARTRIAGLARQRLIRLSMYPCSVDMIELPV